MVSSGSIGYRRMVAAIGVGTFIELYDIVIYGYFAAVLAAQFFPSHDPTAALLATFAIFAVGFFVRPIGAVVFGHIGDRLGRRPALALSLLLMTIATTAFALLPTYDAVGLLAPVLLLTCRVLQGLSASAEIPGAHLLILEYAPPGRRGLAVAVNNAAGQLAAAAAATVSLILARLLTPEQLADWGWRLAFLIAAPVGLVGLYIRTRLIDTPAYLQLGDVARRGSAPLVQAVRTARSGILVVVMANAVPALGVYLVVGYLPTYLVKSAGLTPADAYTANLVAVTTLAGSTLLGGFLVDRYPVRVVAIAVLTGVAVMALPGIVVVTGDRTLVGAMLGQSMWTMFLGASYTVASVLAVVLFPTAIRFTAAAVGLNLGVTLFGATAPYASTWLATETATPTAPGFYLLGLATAGLITIVVGLPRSRDDVRVPVSGQRGHGVTVPGRAS